MRLHDELTLDELLNDPLIARDARDGVDPELGADCAADAGTERAAPLDRRSQPPRKTGRGPPPA